MALTAVMATLATALVAAPASADGNQGASLTIAHTWGVNNRVLAIAQAGASTIIAGEFTKVVDPNGREFTANHVAKFDSATGIFDTTWSAGADDYVNALAVDGDRLYIGGEFQNVNGVAKKYLAAVSVSTGSLESGFIATTNRTVDALAVSGSHLYVGGNFSLLKDTVNRSVDFVGRVNKTTGTVDRTWSDPFTLDARVRSLLAAPDGASVYVGGEFTEINDDFYSGKLASLNTSTPGSINLTFRSGFTNEETRAPILNMDIEGNNLLVAAGGSGGGCTLVDATTGTTTWSKHGNGNVVGVAFFGPYSYCGGHFSGPASFEGLTREKIASVETATGTVTTYDPKINSALGVWSMGSNANNLFIGGDFTKVDAVDQSKFGFFRDTSALEVPAAPGNIASVSGDASVVLTWDVPNTDGGSTVQRYRVFRAVEGGVLDLIDTTEQETYNDSSAVNGVDYIYAVQARNAIGDSPFSATVTGNPESGTINAPSAPLNFNAAGVVNASSLTWDAPSSNGGAPIVEYRIYRATTAGGQTTVPYATVSGSTLAYSDSSITVGTRYYYKVSAVNSAAEGPLSGESSAVPSSGIPGKPVLSLVSAAPHNVQLSWTVPNPGASPITKYVITRNAIRVATINSGAITTWTDTNANAGVSYSYQVKATNSYGTSKNSNKVVVVP